jgi:hypothetical protein
MKTRPFIEILGVSIAALVLASVGSAQTPGEVLSHQKVSDTVGGFAGFLAPGDLFGTSLASLGDMDGDGVIDLAVGARHDDDGGTDRGAVWILFLNADGTVKSHQKISDTAGGFTGALDDGDRFGVSLASLGDHDGDGVTDLAVAAILDDDGGVDRGAVWILFLNADGTVKSHQKISDTVGGFGGALDDDDRFGTDVISLGDLDGDGEGDIAVGATQDDDGLTISSPSRGAVWILFLHADGTVKSRQKISDTKGGFLGVLNDFDEFGRSLACLGDLDGDQVVDLAVGAWADDDGGTNRGAVWILFLNTDGKVKMHQKISATAGGFTGTLDDFDEFGTSVAWMEDQDADGVGELAVGAILDDDGGSGRGAVWVLLLKNDGTVKAHQKISATTGGFTGVLDLYDNFGRSLQSLGDLDGDGLGDLAVGAAMDDDGGFGSDKGAVWMLFLDGTHWLDLGGGTVGSNGAVTLVGTGSLVSGTMANLDLTNAPPGALTLAWLSFASAPQSFFGGTIHATPFTNQIFFIADGSGSVALSTTWPTGIPTGSEAWFQFLVADPSVIWGITLSNGLKITTP